MSTPIRFLSAALAHGGARLSPSAVLPSIAVALLLAFAVAIQPSPADAAQHIQKYLNSNCSKFFKKKSFDEAEKYCKQDLKSAQAENNEFGVDSSLGKLYLIYFYQGRFDDAAQVARRRIALAEKKFGAGSPVAVGLLGGLAKLYDQQGRYAEAEELFKRLLEHHQKTYGAESGASEGVYFMLGRMYLKEDRYAEAQAMLSQALTIAEKAAGITPEHKAVLHYHLGRAYLGTEQLGNAESELKQVLGLIATGAQAWELLRMAMVHQLLGEIYLKRDRKGEVEAALQQASKLIDESKLSEYWVAIELYGELAGLWSELGRHGEALIEARRATAIYRSRKAALQGPLQPKTRRALADARQAVARQMHAIVRVSAEAPEQAAALELEAFEITQFAHESSAAAAIAQMTARFSTGDDALAALVRKQQDAIGRLRGLDDQLTRLVTAPPKQRRPAAEAQARAALAALQGEIRALDQRVSQDFPEFAELMNMESLGLAEAQALLAKDEALLAYFVDDEESYVWVLRDNSATLQSIDIGEGELQDLITFVRASLDPTGILNLSDIGAFDFELAFELYERMFAPLEPHLKGVSHIIEVPDGPLQSLPLGLLVSSLPSLQAGSFKGYAEAKWLAKRFAFTVLPSLSSLRALRRFAREAKSKVPFAGFGDPLLDGHPNTKRSAPLASLFDARGVADVKAVRKLPALPDTASELLRIGRSLGAGEGDLFLRENATERRLRAIDLSVYRIIAFATHGLVAGDIVGLAEPALVMTPPAEGSASDDGLLTASEIAKLELDADWIILSACNTAAPDGSPGSQGFSALARAFFYSGSRALLVSHWPVVSDAAVDLTTRTFAVMSEKKGIGRSEALRRSMLALMSNRDKPHYAHPMFWAPFVVVGEGAYRGAQ